MGITVKVQAGADAASSSIVAPGTMQRVIADAESGVFGLTTSDEVYSPCA